MSFDFNNLQFEDQEQDDLSKIQDSKQLVELLGEYQTGIYTFYNMQTEFRKSLVENPESLLQYCKEQLEGRNIHGHYITNLTKVTRCKHNQVVLGHGIAGINLQLILEYQYRIFQKGSLFVVKGSVDHIDKVSSYGDDIPIYGEYNKEISGFMTVKDKSARAKKLLQLLSSEYIKKGLAFPVEIYSFEINANSRDVVTVVQPLLPRAPLAFQLVNNPPEGNGAWEYLQNKIDIAAEPGSNFRNDLEAVQRSLALYNDTNLKEFGLRKGDKFLYDSIGASFNDLIKEDQLAVPIDWNTLCEMVYTSYASLFNITNHFTNVGIKDKYLLEFSRSKNL